MTEPDITTVFAGVDDRTTAVLPPWFARETGTTDPTSFATAIRNLPRAVTTDVAFRNPHTDDWVETDQFTALVEPTRLTTATRSENTPASEAIFHIPTNSYAVINPVDVYGPLASLLRETTLDGHNLDEIVFGEIRQYRGGGEVHVDVMFDGLYAELPDRADPITMGVTTGYDFFGGHAVYVEGFARDTTCANSIRGLTDRETVRHVGDGVDFEDWWNERLSQLGLIADDLVAFIEDAQAITIDFTDVPFTIAEFYELLDFPAYLADRAAGDVRAGASDPFEIDMWTLHSGATYALTHCFTGKEGSSLDRYVRTANDILFNPEATIATVEQVYEQQAAAETDPEGQTDLASQTALAQVERVSQDIHEKATQFEEREATLRERFSPAND